MHKINYQPVPYSFSRDRHFIQLINNEKSCNQIETNEQSDTSDLMEMHFNKQSMRTDNSYSSLIKSMREQVQYHKEALKTAQSLISNYQKQNNNLKQQNIKITDQLKKVTIKLQNVQRLLFKLFHFQKSQTNSPSKKNTQTSQTLFEKQTLDTFGRRDDDIQPDLYKRIQKIYQRQMLYQQQILSLNNKIKLLQKSSHSDIKNMHKNKLKNSVYIPFTCNQTITDQKIKIANRLIQIYGNQQKNLSNQKTFRPHINKHTQFKKNLQKQFELFLQKTKTTTKSKTSILKTPQSTNFKSNHSVSLSTQKRNSSKRSTSITKK